MDSDCDKRLIKEKLNMHVKRRLKDPVTLTKIKTHVKKNEVRKKRFNICSSNKTEQNYANFSVEKGNPISTAKS